jgi:hypothetical protein
MGSTGADTLSCHTGADEFGDGELLYAGGGVGVGKSPDGGDGLGNGESLYA